MSLPSLQARRRNVRPVVDGLESRELLERRTSGPRPGLHDQRAGDVPGVDRRSALLATDAERLDRSAGAAPADMNPYGVAFVPSHFPQGGPLHPGDVLVSNFNNSLNVQGTGTTIVRITPQGQQSVFFTSTEPGLSTALGVLKGGFVIVGNVPTPDGTFATWGRDRSRSSTASATRCSS